MDNNVTTPAHLTAVPRPRQPKATNPTTYGTANTVNPRLPGRVVLARADARAIPLPDASVDLIVTSPPYYGLRSYTDGGEHYDTQIGAEPTPREYIAALIECTREWARVLKPTGSLFVNLGDSYHSGKGAPSRTTVDAKNAGRTARRAGVSPLDRSDLGFPRKSLLLLPERYRIAAVDELGLIARAVVVWSKPNGMPESVTDRVRRSHEDWVHLAKAPRYYSAVDEIREQPARWDPPRPLGTRNKTQHHQAATDNTGWKDHLVAQNPLGKLPGSVWEIATQPLKVPAELGVGHYAAFPMEWPRRIVQGWSPTGICTACGEGRQPVTERSRVADRRGRVQGRSVDALLGGHGQDGRAGSRYSASVAVTGEACACSDTSAPTRPAVVLDPFGGTGTTALVAAALGRTGISLDRSADYTNVVARWRTSDAAQIARALGKPPCPEEPAGQGDLFPGLLP